MTIRKVDGHLIATDSSCRKVRELVTAVTSWSKKSALFCPVQKQSVAQSMPERCSADLSACVPSVVLALHDEVPRASGPNCWNAALVASGVLPHIRFTSPEEFRYFLNSPLCRALENGEAKQPGDVGAIRVVAPQGGGMVEWHGFIYLNDEFAFSKDGAKKSAKYAIQSLEETLRTYSVPADERCRQNRIERNSKCNYAVSYFRCHSMAEYLRDSQVPAWYVKAEKGFADFEAHVQNDLLRRGSIPETAKDEFREVLRDLLVRFETMQKEELAQGHTHHPDRPYIEALQPRLDGLIQQLDPIGESVFSSELADTENGMWGYLFDTNQDRPVPN